MFVSLPIKIIHLADFCQYNFIAPLLFLYYTNTTNDSCDFYTQKLYLPCYWQ